jgi:FAD/FMN-containing dehydrogenase
LVNADANIIHCSRSENAELFTLVCGGYGLFGVIYAATLRLAPRQRLQRCVDVIDIDDAVNAIYRRVQEGCLYGDFQFAIDAADARFLRRGVLACYRPVEASDASDSEPADLSPETWLRLLRLAHDDKRLAFELYSQHYLKTDGQHYWSDTHQLSTYLPGYQEYLQTHATATQSHAGHPIAGQIPASLMISELYVPAAALLNFLASARVLLAELGSEVIYGTIRSIRQDQDSFLPWAQRDFVCVVFNLRTEHSASGIDKTKRAFQGLIDIALALSGSFYLTYHRYASAAQVLRAYPKLRQFFALKRRYDPNERFQSEWYRHYLAELVLSDVL